MECTVCQVSEQELRELERRLNKCPFCYKFVCEKCAQRSIGRDFCSKTCAQNFIFGLGDVYDLTAPAVVMRAILDAEFSANQRLPSCPVAMPMG